MAGEVVEVGGGACEHLGHTIRAAPLKGDRYSVEVPFVWTVPNSGSTR